MHDQSPTIAFVCQSGLLGLSSLHLHSVLHQPRIARFSNWMASSLMERLSYMIQCRNYVFEWLRGRACARDSQEMALRGQAMHLMDTRDGLRPRFWNIFLNAPQWAQIYHAVITGLSAPTQEACAERRIIRTIVLLGGVIVLGSQSDAFVFLGWFDL